MAAEPWEEELLTAFEDCDLFTVGKVAIAHGLPRKARRIEVFGKGEEDGVIEPEFSEEARANLLEKMRQFDERLKLDREKLAFDKDKHREDNQLKDKISLRQAKNRSNSSNSTK